MTRVTATEARKKFFDILDRAAHGESVLIERGKTVLRLVRNQPALSRKKPDYRGLVRGRVDQADRWSWDRKPSGGLKLKHTR